jgi:hypothetical protein
VSDPELARAARRLERLGFDVGHPGAARTLPNRALHAFHRLVLTFEKDLDSPVGQIANDAPDALELRLLVGKEPEAYALNPSRDEESPRHEHSYQPRSSNVVSRS